MREGLAYCQMIFEEGEARDFVYLAVNPAFETLTGLQNVTGKRVSEAIPGIRETDPELLRTYARVAETGVPEKFERFVEAPRMWFSISVSSPKKGFFVALFDAITERKLAEKALRESEEDLRALFDDAPLPYHELDRNGTVVRVNRLECELLGVEASQMVGRPIWDFVSPREREESRAAVARKLAGPRVPPVTERKFHTRAGGEITLQFHDRLITDAEGNVLGLRTAAIDLTETRRLKAQLAKERRLLGALMDQSPDHIYFKDNAGHFTLVNLAQARLLGYSNPSQVVGKTDFDFFSAEHAEPAFQDEQDLVHERLPVISKEEKETWPDGRETWVSTTKLPLRDSSGRIVGTFGISRDITERHRMEQALSESEARLKLAQEALDIGTWDLDLVTGRAECSEQLSRLYGRAKRVELSTAEWLSSVHPDDREKVRSDVEESLRTGQPSTRRFRVVWPDGGIHWLHSMSRVIRDAGNKPVRAIGIDFDITEQARNEEQLRVLSAAVEQCPVSVVITDLAGTIEYVNPKTTELTGYTAQELIGQNSRIFKSGETTPSEYENLWRTIRSGEWRGTFHNRKKNGELFWETAAIRPILSPSGTPTHYLAVKEDITARKRAEDKIAWLASFPEQDPNPVVEIEVPGGSVHYANPAARALFLDLHQQGLAHAWLGGLEHMTDRETGATGNEAGQDLTVGDRCYSRIGHYLPELGRLRVYGLDITDRKRAEDALRHSETKFRAIYDFTSDAVMLLDQRGFLDCNHAALAMFGCPTREEYCSRHPGDMSPPQQPCGTDSTTLANRHIAAAMEKGTDRFEWVHRRVDNSETFHAEVLLNAMELDGKRVLQAVVRDITERKRAEDALRASELKYRTLVRHIPQRVVYKDRESVFVSCNDLFARDLGIPAAEIAGKTDFDIHPRELAEKYRADDRRVMDSGETLEFEEERAINGVVRTVFSVRTPVIGEKGEVIGVLVVFTDVTERKRAELALRLAERQLLQSQKLESVGQLAAGIAHEINTPIQYVGDNANFLEQAFRDLAPFLGSHERIVRALRDSPESEFAGELERQLQEADVDYLRDEVPRAIGQLTEGVEQVARIVRAMKEFSHPGPVERTFLDLNHAIESTILVSRNEWKHVADLTADLDPALPPVPCLAGEINQVVLNLIVNAAHAIGDVMKATGQKGVIHVSTRHHEAWAEIRVRDTGTGIPEAIQSKVFDPFFTTKQVGKGTGQGLSIAHGVIVKRHGGRISFETQVGAGTTFLIQLPLENREQP